MNVAEQRAKRHLESRGYRWLDKDVSGRGGLWRVKSIDQYDRASVDRVERFANIFEAVAYVERIDPSPPYRWGKRIGWSLAAVGVSLTVILILRLAVYMVQTLT